MNYKLVLHTVGQILKVESALMILPLSVAIFYKENTVFSFCLAITLTLIVASIFTLLPQQKNQMYEREGLLIVALSWISMSLFGALPLFLSGAVDNYLDCVFEIVSGFTTTGATIIQDVEILPKSINFWRCFTHWIGGMGILVFVLAILPNRGMRSMHILRAEVPGPTKGKLVAKTRMTATILYSIYIVITLLEALLLRLGGNTFFDSITVAFSTAGTGGYASYNASIGAYNSLYTEIICIVFMIIFSLNFNIFYLILLRQVKRALKSEELWIFLGVFLFSVLMIASNIYSVYGTVAVAIRHSFFNVASIISTTGHLTVNINDWPKFSQTLLLILMFFGGCAGSTAGGLKFSRVMILVKSAARGLKKTLRPRSVETVKIDNQFLGFDVVHGASTFFLIYFVTIVVSSLLISIDSYGNEVVLPSVISCINNVGPIIGGPSTFHDFSKLSKVVFTLDMLIGRLEIYPILVLFMPSTWKKR